MLGLAGSITPTSSGNVAIWIAGDGTNNTLGDGCILRITMGTGTAPTNGQALTGTDWSPADLVVQANVATDVVPFPALGYATGLTIGTPYWYDIAFAALTGGTCTLSKIGATAFEQ
ncbi:MAG TPA: hypothetical protein VGR70_09900 [Stellaceae bacterium]|nr:hypothetical protein [Stellaceae bacterium]